MFGWVSLVGGIALIVTMLLVARSVLLLGTVLVLIGIIGALVSARISRGRVAAFSCLQFAGVVVAQFGPFLANYRLDVVFVVGGLLAIAGAVGVIVSGHRAAPAPAPTAQPLGYTSDGQPFYPVVGYRTDGTPVTADQAPGYSQSAARYNSMAITAFVLALVLTPLAIPFGHVARAQIRRTGEQGGGLAVAALTIGYIWLGVVAVVIVMALSGAPIL